MKNLTLSLIIIAIYSKFAFAREPLKYGGAKIFDAFQDEKKYAVIFSNHSSNVKRVTCPSGYYECFGTGFCCEGECGAICKNGCCEPGQTCCEKACCAPGSVCQEDGHCCLPGYNSCGNGYCCKKGSICGIGGCSVITSETTSTSTSTRKTTLSTLIPTIPTRTTTPTRTLSTEEPEETEQPEEPEVPEQSISCGLTAKKIKGTTYRETAKNADPGTFAYGYYKGEIVQTTLDVIKDSFDYFYADHVFDPQIIINWLKRLTVEVREKMCCSIMLDLNELTYIISNETNLRFLYKDIYNAKKELFMGNTISDREHEIAVSKYLAMEDVYNAFVTTRSKVIDILVNDWNP